jgi:hypothetical protein
MVGPRPGVLRPSSPSSGETLQLELNYKPTTDYPKYSFLGFGALMKFSTVVGLAAALGLGACGNDPVPQDSGTGQGASDLAGRAAAGTPNITAGAGGSAPSVVGTYLATFVLAKNTCGSQIPPTSSQMWELRMVAGKIALVVPSGASLLSDDGGNTFTMSIPVNASDCAGTSTYMIKLTHDGNGFYGTTTTDIRVNATCSITSSCSYTNNVLGQRQ